MRKYYLAPSAAFGLGLLVIFGYTLQAFVAEGLTQKSTVSRRVA